MPVATVTLADARVVLSTPNQGWRGNREAVFMSSNVNPRTVTLTWESKDRLVIEYEYSYSANIAKALPCLGSYIRSVPRWR